MMELWLSRQHELAIFVGLVALFVVAAESGYLLARDQAKSLSDRELAETGTIQAAVLGLLALLLGFTFSMAATRYDARKEVVREEANAIGTAWLRKDLLPEPQRANVARLLRQYIDSRFDLQETRGDPERVGAVSAKAGLLQSRIWAEAAAAAERNPQSLPVSLAVRALSDMIDMDGRQLASLRNRIPFAIFAALAFVAAIALGLTGYGSGAAGKHRFSLTLVVSLLVASVITLTVDLHRPTRGLIHIDLQSYTDVRNGMTAK